MDVVIPAGASRLVIERDVIRCGCGQPSVHAAAGEVCPTPAGIEKQRPVYWHRNRLRRIWFRLTGRVT